MYVAHTVVTVLGAAMVGFSAYSVFSRATWVVEPLTQYGVPQSWWPRLGLAKAAGAIGLLVGLAVPVLGTIAGVCVVLYFLGAVLTVARAKAWGHIVFPLIYAAPVVAALALQG
jgi:hypothetical protein